jgi:hypothetical protein
VEYRFEFGAVMIAACGTSQADRLESIINM